MSKRKVIRVTVELQKLDQIPIEISCKDYGGESLEFRYSENFFNIRLIN